MKVPRDGSENRSEFRKSYQKSNSCNDGKITKEKKELSVKKGEEGELSSRAIQPSAAALIPPWLRNTFGLAEKDVKPNQKCLQLYSATNNLALSPETGGKNAESNGDYLKCHFYIQDTPDANPILEVNIGSEADFLKDSAEKLSSQWRAKSSRHSQYECDLLALGKERELPKSLKSEVTSIDVMVPTDDREEDKRRMRSQKGKWKSGRINWNGSFATDENLKNDTDGILRSVETDLIEDFFKGEALPNGKNLDGRLLLLCGKKEVDNLTEKDVALLQEMKNQIGHKEGIEKLFSEIGESTLVDKGTRRMERKEDKESKREDKVLLLLGKSMESKVTTKGKGIDEERKHHEKKSKIQQRHARCSDEVEKDKKVEKWNVFGQRPRSVHAEKEKKSKPRHSEYPPVEKVVTETLQKYIDLYRLQVPPEVVNSMKKNILQNLQTDYQETSSFKKSLDAVFAVQDQFYNSGGIKCTVHHLITDDQQNGYRSGMGVKKVNFTPEESVVSKDISVEETSLKTRVEGGKAQALNILRKDFETCLELIQNQMDVTGTRLCSAILEKNGTEDTKLRIVHNFTNGVTESVKIYDRSNFGNPEGDSIRTVSCDCQRNLQKMTKNQWIQTNNQIYGDMTTQTDFVDVSFKQVRNADLTPGLYRITKAAEFGRFYLTPEILDDYGTEEDNKLKRVPSEVCVRSINGKFKNELLNYGSRETFFSDKFNPDLRIRSLWRTFRSDCVGLNNSGAWEVKKLTENTIVNVEKEIEVQQENDIVEINMNSQREMNRSYDVLTETKKDEVEQKEITSDRELCHKECVWLWNGEKMSPGVDLKIHVEDLLREKLAEILYDSRNESTAEHVSDASGKNLEIRKTEAKFCITNEEAAISDSSPFIFKASALEDSSWKTELPAFSPEESMKGKLVREVGTQNSQHGNFLLNLRRPKQRSKLCTVAKFSKRRQSNYQRFHRSNSKFSETIRPFAESVGEAKKVKFDFREDKDIDSIREKGNEGNSDSVRECFSIISNTSSSSDERPVRVKLIGIEVSKEKSHEDVDVSSRNNSETKGYVIEGHPEDEKKLKHWEIIENVLNRVNQKEKDFLWNDIRDFLKKKFGRDINDEGAKEVCIEIEQDVPKFAKGKSSRMVVARGNYTRNEGDVEVEVDLTLDDLERILRHRQKKMRSRRMHTSQKTETKETSASSSDSITEYRNHLT